MTSPSPLATLPVEFVGSYPDPTMRLTPRRAEIALLGRSNVGKSSLLNALLGRPVARVSNTPGRTSLLNVFSLPGFYLIDLPGYGWARASHAARAKYAKLIRDTIVKRRSLSGILWLLDIRHDPSKEDREYLEILEERELPVLVALTKADKLTQRDRHRRSKEVAALLAFPLEQVQLTSSATGLGMEELAESLMAFAEGAAE
jgi:GTP-binding protein